MTNTVHVGEIIISLFLDELVLQRSCCIKSLQIREQGIVGVFDEKRCTFIIDKSHLCMRKRGFAGPTLTFTLSLRLVRGSFLFLHRPESSETVSVRLSSAVSLRKRFSLCRLLL